MGGAQEQGAGGGTMEGRASGSSKHVTCTCICAACIRAAPQHICFDEDFFLTRYESPGKTLAFF